ncbi:MAG: hypothetical protein K0S28_1117 [Paucimonas sp.]|jgi:hypothetical protein|nr:hypothetical protein [Paucimonas sp.]
MKKSLFFALLLPQICLAQEAPANVTKDQIAAYKSGVKGGCLDGGKQKPDFDAASFCGCVIKVLNKSMSHKEWQQAVFYERNGKNEEEVQVLRPHMEKVNVCLPKKK